MPVRGPSGVRRSGAVSVSKHFLFLQGGVSSFFSRLAGRLRRDGHQISRFHFCGGDWLVWRHSGAVAFQAPLRQLRTRLETFCDMEGVTDILLFGGCRPVHQDALSLARARGLRAHVLEEGYLRPNWLTLERGGVNGASPMPRDPSWYLRVAARVPDRTAQTLRPGSAAGADLLERAWRGGLYQLARVADPLLFPHYRSHRPDQLRREILGWAKRFSRLARRQCDDQALCDRLAMEQRPLFLLPLQLHGDAQVSCYSRFSGMRELIEEVIDSFARRAPSDAQLLIKNHPLDHGLRDYEALSRRLAKRAGVAERVHYVETGDLQRLLAACEGVITINSTAGLSAVLKGCPTLALGQTVYRMPGLTDQGPLDAFWDQRLRPDPALTDAFVRVLIHATQLQGDLYRNRAVAAAVEQSMRFIGEDSPLEQLLRLDTKDHPGEVPGRPLR